MIGNDPALIGAGAAAVFVTVAFLRQVLARREREREAWRRWYRGRRRV